MPFDATPDSKLVNRIRLVEALRQPVADWDFSQFDKCACHVAVLIGLVSDHFSYKALGRKLGLDKDQTEDILLGTGHFYGVCKALVTPAMVADALERIK